MLSENETRFHKQHCLGIESAIGLWRDGGEGEEIEGEKKEGGASMRKYNKVREGPTGNWALSIWPWEWE